MKQILKLSLLLLAILLPTTATAHSFEVNGIYYNFINEHEVAVSMKGSPGLSINSSTNYLINRDEYIPDYYSGDIVIPETVNYEGVTYSVTAIDFGAFAGCAYVTSVTIGNNVTRIATGAFSNCTGLTSVTFPNSVTVIWQQAFAYCSNLTSIIIGSSVTTIGDGAFSGCDGLNNIICLATTPPTLGDNAFSNYNAMLVVPKRCKSAYLAASNWSYFSMISEFGSDFEINGIYYAITGSNTIEVTYNDPSFNNYSGEVTIPSNVTYNNQTYQVTAIGDYAFYSCDGLTNVTVPNSVTSFGDYAFSWSNNLTNVNIPNSVISIGESAFYYCSSLTNISIPNSVVSIGGSAFEGCGGLTGVTIPNSVTQIGPCAFRNCSGLNYIDISNSVTTIYQGTFDGCTSLTSLTIPNSVTQILWNAFFGCSGLISVTIPNSVTSIGNGAFEGCNNITELTWNARNCPDNGNMSTSNIENVIIGEDVEYLPNYFVANSKITQLTIPSSVTTIGNFAFYGCIGLTSVDIPNAVTTIGYRTFYGCSRLTTVSIPSSVTFVGEMAFGNIPTIESVTCAATTPPTSNGVGIFSNNVHLHAPLYVPKGSERAYMADPCWGQFINIIGIGMEDEVLATSISLNKPQVNLLVGGTSQLVATVLPDSTTNKTVAWASSNSNVATVSNDGTVTALAAGNTTITAMTTDGSNLSASCLIGVTEDFSDYDDYLLLSDMEAFHGDTIVIPVTMVNASNITAFQTDIFLPEGLELLKEDGEYLIDPSERMTRSHSLISDDVSNGAIRVVCYSSNYRPFTGESGDDLFYLTVKVVDDAEGDYIVHLKNTLLTNTDFVDIVAPDVDGTINVKAYILGDANDSRTVTITDVVVTAQYVLERNPQPFIFEAADVNKDNYITIADVARIAWIVLNPDEANAPLRASVIMDCGDYMSGEGVSLAIGETRTVSIALDNEMDYTAFQMDLTMPEGLTASNFKVTDRTGSHVFDVNTLHNGDIRVLCYSPALTAIGGNEGALLTFDVTATAPVTGDIAVDGIELVTTACQTVKPDGFVIGVNNATGVNELATGKTVARVEYFNLAGQRVDQPESGVTLVVTTYTDGTRTTTKVIQ